MKTYLYALGATLLTAAIMGFIGPMLVSSRDDFGVVAGFLFVGVLPIMVGWMVWNWKRSREGKKIVKSIKENF